MNITCILIYVNISLYHTNMYHPSQINFTIVATVSELTGQLNQEYSRIKYVHTTAFLHPPDKSMHFPG